MREFHIALIDIAFKQTYLMILFPKSLAGQALEWFTHLPIGIRSWDELADKFITQFSFNIENDITIATLCHTKQE